MKISIKNTVLIISLGVNSILLAPKDSDGFEVPTVETTMLMHVINGNHNRASKTISKLSSLDIRNERGQTLLDISIASDRKKGLSKESQMTQLLRICGAKTATGYDYSELYCDEKL